MQYRADTKQVVEYRFPDCGEKVETPARAAKSADFDTYESVFCPSCRQLHCVNAADGEVIAEDELGDPW